MTEKNRHILKKALSELPAKKAGKSSWAGISGSLDELDGSRFLSNNLSSLPKHKAPESAWAGIKAGIGRPWYALTGGGAIKTGSLALALTALIFGAAFLFSDRNEDREQHFKQTLIEKSEEISASTGQPKEIQSTETLDNIADQNKNTDPVSAETRESNIVASDIKQKRYPAAASSPESRENKNMEKQNREQRNTGRKEIILTDMSGKSFSGIEHNRTLHARTNLSDISSEADYYRKPQHSDISVGAHYSLLNFQNGNIPQMELPESVSSFGLEVMVEYRKFFIKTGLSYLSLEDKAQYTFNYKQQELIYSYNYVDSALYNPFSGSIEYYTTQREVFDSVAHRQDDQIRYRYRVLQLPLMAGYKLIQNDHFMISLNGGLGADIRLGGKSFIPVFNESNSSITNTENHLAYRFGLNWRVMAGFGLYYKISGNFSFYLEPSYQQYLKSVYENASLDKATYIEFKSGIIFKF